MNELDSNMVQTCGTPENPDITTPDSDITATDPETSTTDPEDTTISTDPIITQSPPVEPPTTTPQTPEDPSSTTSDGDITTQTQTLPVTPPTTTPQVPVSPPVLLGHKLQGILRELLGDYQCFVVHRQGKTFVTFKVLNFLFFCLYKQIPIFRNFVFYVFFLVGNAIQVNRGCVVTRETIDQTCFEANAGVNPDFCRLCSYDECNNASKYVVSLVVLLSSFFVILTIR